MSNSTGATGIPPGPIKALVRAKNLNVLQWNAGGLSHPKMTEIKHIAHKYDIDILLINEANVSANNIKYYNIKGYKIHALYKARQIASGILIAVKNHIISKFRIIKEMDDHDTAEIIELEVWMDKRKFIIYGIYSPPRNNNLNLDLLNISTSTIIMGDFNAASPNWGYNYYNSQGRTLEDFLSSNEMELVYDPNDPKTFIHHTGNCTNPDLTLVSTNLYEHCKRSIIEDLGCQHRAVMLTLTQNHQTQKTTSKITWNFKKARWQDFQNHLETKAREINLEEPPHTKLKKLCDIILETAKRTIPRGKQPRYKPFWTKTLENLKHTRNQARLTAEKSKKPEDVIIWKKESAKFKKQLILTKRETWHNFLKQMNYKTDGSKGYKLINTLNNKYPPKQSQLFTINNKETTDSEAIANHFNSFFTTSHKLSNTCKKEEKKLKKQKVPDRATTSEELFYKDFSSEELKEAIKLTKIKRQPGPDEIFPEFV